VSDPVTVSIAVTVTRAVQRRADIFLQVVQGVQHSAYQPTSRTGVAVEMPTAWIVTLTHVVLDFLHQIVQVMNGAIQLAQIRLQVFQVATIVSDLVNVIRITLDTPSIGHQVAELRRVTVMVLQFVHETVGLPL
jgi:hypothetical protein